MARQRKILKVRPRLRCNFGRCLEDGRAGIQPLTLSSVFAQARDKTALSRGKFLGPILSNQLQGYPGLQPHLDYRAADPKPYVTYFPGLVSHTAVHQRVHFLDDNSGGTSAVFDVPINSIITPTDLLPKEQNLTRDAHGSTSDPGPKTIAPLGDVVYSRSGDKGANVNVGFFFPMGKDMRMKWEWLRSFLTSEKFSGRSHIQPGTALDINLTLWQNFLRWITGRMPI